MNPKDIVTHNQTKADRARKRKAFVKTLVAGGHSRSTAIKLAKESIK